MNWRREYKALAGITVGFLLFYFLPLDRLPFDGPIFEALALTHWYAREHVILCLLPAFFIAGAIAVFVGQASVMKYLGPKANKVVAYGVASVSGSILAVCSCTVLPLFAGIYRMGAGLGPATAFLYSGPAINVLAIILTTRVLGWQLGVARAIGAVLFAIVIGLLMHFIFRHEKTDSAANMVLPDDPSDRPLWKTGLYFGSMVGILIFATWSRPEDASGWATLIFGLKWWLTSAAALGLGAMLIFWFGLPWLPIALNAAICAILAFMLPDQPLIPFVVGLFGLSLIVSRRSDETGDWFEQSWGFAKQIMPLLLGGVLVAGLLLGRPGEVGLIPMTWIEQSVGGNSIAATLFASVVGAFMYFATLTEIPILQGLLSNGMGQGPALALLLAGPALSLPNMLVIRSVIGTRKTVVFVALVIAMATLTGQIYSLII